VPVALSIAALRKARLPLTIPQPVRRAASALHGESDWLPIAEAMVARTSRNRNGNAGG